MTSFFAPVPGSCYVRTSASSPQESTVVVMGGFFPAHAVSTRLIRITSWPIVIFPRGGTGGVPELLDYSSQNKRDTGLTKNRGFWCLHRFGKTGGRVWAQFATLPWALGWGICKSLPISGILGEPGPREENGMMQARSAGRGDGIGEWCLIFHP
jgi:hypothetical protein